MNDYFGQMDTNQRHMLLLITLLAALTTNAQQRQQRKIIDVHLHARAAAAYGVPPMPNPVTGKAPQWKEDGEVVKTTLDTLKKYNVVKAIVSGNENHVTRYTKADPLRFVPSLDYGDNEKTIVDTATFRKLFTNKAFEVFGELALQYDGKLLTDPQLEPYLSICESLGIPVALHTGLASPNAPYQCCPAFRTNLGNPQLIEEVLVRHPKLKIQLMHMGYPYLQETKAIMYVYPQVYADVAVIDWILPPTEFHTYLKAMIDAGYGQRIMYGSDQMGWPDAIPLSIKNVESASFLTEEQKQDIFYNNAVRFYNLKKQ